MTPLSIEASSSRILQMLTVERLAYLAIGLLAAVVRFAGLGHSPMNSAEAQQAVAALGLLHNASTLPPAGVSPLLLNLHWATFLVFHSTESLARFWPALAGVALVFLPLGLRRELGRLGALLAALLLALSSSLIFWSRSATGGSFALLAAMALVVGLAGFRRDRDGRWVIWLAASLALLLLSAPASAMVLALLAPLAVLALWPQRPIDDGQSPISTVSRSALVTAGVLFAAILLLGGTAMFFNPGGLAAAADLPVEWLRQFGRSAAEGYSLLWSLLQVILAEPLLLVLGLAGLAMGLRRRDWFAQGLGLWLALAVALIVVRPGRNPLDGALLALPLALLGGPALAEFLQRLAGGVDDQRLEAAVLFVAGIGVLVSAAIWLANYSASWNPQPQTAFLVSAGAVLAVLAVVLVAYALIFGGRLTAWVGLALLLCILLVLSLRAAAQMNHNRDGLVWGSFLRTIGADDGPNLTAYLSRLADQRGGDLRDLSAVVLVAPGNEPSPLLRWYLRDAQVRFAAGASAAAPDEVLVSLAPLPGQGPDADTIQPAAPPGSQPYSGRSFRLSQSWTPDGLRGKALWNWLLYGHFDALDGQQRAVVWVSNQPAGQ